MDGPPAGVVSPVRRLRGGEAVVSAGPVVADSAEAGAADDAAENEGNDDGVVGVAENRDEVGD